MYLSASRLHGEWAFDPTAVHWDSRRPSSPASRLLPGPPYNREDRVHTKPRGHAVQHQSSWDSSPAWEQHEGHVSIFLRKMLRKRKKHRKALWGKCLYHIILYIHMHPVHISCNKQHWKNPSVLPPIPLLWRQLLSRSVFLCAHAFDRVPALWVSLVWAPGLVLQEASGRVVPVMARWGLFYKPGGSGLTSSAFSLHSIMDVTLNLYKKKKHTPLWILFQSLLSSVPSLPRFCSKAKKWLCPMFQCSLYNFKKKIIFCALYIEFGLDA